MSGAICCHLCLGDSVKLEFCHILFYVSRHADLLSVSGQYLLQIPKAYSFFSLCLILLVEICTFDLKAL